MKIAMRTFLSRACIAVPIVGDVLLRHFLEVQSIGMVPAILLYGPFLFLLRLIWAGKFEKKPSPAIPTESAVSDSPPVPSRKFSAAYLLFAALFLCGCLASYWAGRESISSYLQAQYDAGYQDGQSEAAEADISELEAREESFQDGYHTAMRDAGISPYNPSGMPLLSPNSFYDFDSRNTLRVDLAKSYGLSPVRTAQETEALFRSLSGGS